MPRKSAAGSSICAVTASVRSRAFWWLRSAAIGAASRSSMRSRASCHCRSVRRWRSGSTNGSEQIEDSLLSRWTLDSELRNQQCRACHGHALQEEGSLDALHLRVGGGHHADAVHGDRHGYEEQKNQPATETRSAIRDDQ